MAEKLVMLALSPTMETGTIAKWTKNEGDTVASGDVVCEVETDKATMEYESTADGTLLKVIVGSGGQVKVGDPIAIVGEEGEDISQLLSQVASASAAASPKPASAPSEDSAAGPATNPPPESIPAGPSAQRPAPQAPEASAAPGGVLASPLARRLAREKGIDLRSVRGSGPGGRIVKRDLETAPAGVSPVPAAGRGGGHIIPVSEKRKAIAARLTGSFQFAPHYYLKTAVDAGTLLEERRRVNAAASEKVGLNAFLMKFVAEALKRHPMVNASWRGESIVQHARIDIALAVAQPDGLITPVVRDCASKGIVQIDGELKVLVERARTNKLTPEEYSGSTFTISNLGTFGVREFTAIINPPESAILAVGEISKQAVVEEGDRISIRPLMTLTLSCDHRILDGAVSAAFMQTVKSMIEDPINLVL
ncbi:MAG: hypothetical protein GF418_12540 [Chitinivibrionales bacterium]|nr:hypothetical protein [Chitinivibrionales bacterium]MBD3396447.1 hypothetical protein [Chitinivibrionales bacterium]